VGSLLPGIFLFHQITPVALAANVVAAPIAGAVTVLAAVSSTMVPFFSVGAIGMNLLNARLVHLLAGVLGWMATWPGGHFAVSDPKVWFEREPAVEIVAVEGATPTLVKGEGGKWLIEPGSKIAWGNSVRPLLNYYGVNQLDGVMLAAGFAKRSGSAQELLGSMPIGWWGESGLGGRSGALKQWRSEMVERKKGRRFFEAGDLVELGQEWRVEVLWPAEGSASGRAEEDGLVMRLECGQARLLWAGSIPGEVERKLVQRYGEKLRAGILVQGPSQGMNLTADWLRTVRPNYLIRSWKSLEDDPSLSVDFDQISKEIWLTLVPLKESGAVQLKPGHEGGWIIHRWRAD
jgi:beta-lactamase superfamily II metal-dependent hydrolase